MRTAFTSLLLFAAMAGAQTINPNQIRPGTNGQVITTSGGVTGWGNGQITLGSTPLSLGGTYTTITGLTINGVSLSSSGSTSLFLNQAGTYTAPTVSAPTFNLIGTGTNTTAAMVCGTGCTLTPTGTGVITPNAINLAALGNGGIVGNLPVANLNGGINASAATAWFGDGTWKAISPGGVTSINTQAGAIVFTGAGVSNTGNTFTFSGAGPANISGGTAGHVPLFGSATTITANSHIDEVTTPGFTTITQPAIINDGTGKAGNIGLTAGTAPSAAPANTIQINAPTSVTAYSIAMPSAQGTGALVNNGSGTLSWSATGGCPTCITSAASLTNNAVMIGGGSQASSTISADTTTTHALFATAGAPAFRAIAAGDLPASSVCIPGAFAAQTDAATVTWAIGSSICANASLTFTVHGGSRTLNLTGLVNGGSYVIWLKQDGTGGEGLTLGTGCTWKVGGGGGGAITPSITANAIDVLAFTYDGTNCYANFRANFN